MVKKPVGLKGDESASAPTYGNVSSLESSTNGQSVGGPKRLTRLTKGKESPSDNSPIKTPLRSNQSETPTSAQTNPTVLEQVMLPGSVKRGEGRPEGGRGGRRPRKPLTEAPAAEPRPKRKYVRKAPLPSAANANVTPARAAAQSKARLNTLAKANKSRESLDRDDRNSSVSAEELPTSNTDNPGPSTVIPEPDTTRVQRKSPIANDSIFVHQKQFEVLKGEVNVLQQKFQRFEGSVSPAELEDLKKGHELFSALAKAALGSLTAAKIQSVIEWATKNCDPTISERITAELKKKPNKSGRLGVAKRGTRATNNKSKVERDTKSPVSDASVDQEPKTSQKVSVSKAVEETAELNTITANEPVERKGVAAIVRETGPEGEDQELLGKRKARGGRRGGFRGGRGRGAKVQEGATRAVSESKPTDTSTPIKKGRGGRGGSRGGRGGNRRSVRLGQEATTDPNAVNSNILEASKTDDETDEIKKNDTISGRQTGAGDSEARDSSSQEVKPTVGLVGLSMSPTRAVDEIDNLEGGDNIQAVC